MSKQHCQVVQVEKLNVASTLLPFLANSKPIDLEHVQFVSTLSKGRNFTMNSFATVAVLATNSGVVSTKSNVASTFLLVWTGL